MKATREWFRQIVAEYDTRERAYVWDIPVSEDPSGNEWYPWTDITPPILPGQVWATRDNGAIMVLAVNGRKTRVEWGGALYGSGVTDMPNLSIGEACLVWGPRAPWCPLRVWKEEEKKTWPPS